MGTYRIEPHDGSCAGRQAHKICLALDAAGGAFVDEWEGQVVRVVDEEGRGT